MADSENDKKPGKPPRIKLSTDSEKGLVKPKTPTGKGKETARIDLSESKTDLDSAKIDLASAASDLSSAAPDDTTRIDLPKPPGAIKAKEKSDTSKLDLAAARPVDDKDDTSRIDLPGHKSQTARVSLSEAKPVPAPAADSAPPEEAGPADDDFGDFSPGTSGIQTLSASDKEAILKQSTMRVDLNDEEDKKSEAPVATRNQTMRVELDDKSPGNITARVEAPKSETARVEAPPAKRLSPASVGTARIPLDDDEVGGDDVLKRRGTPDPESVAPPKPEPPPDTDIDEALPHSQTARIAVPVEIEKSKTARIEVPAEIATSGGRPKTIRIKRADSTEGPLQAPVPEPSIKRGAKGKKGRKPTIKTEEVSNLFPALALASLLIIGVVIYVLVAQILDPSLPWIGKVNL